LIENTSGENKRMLLEMNDIIDDKVRIK